MRAIELMAKEALGKVFEGLPVLNDPRVNMMLLNRMRREIVKQSEADLRKYLNLLVLLGTSISTGENFDKLMEDGPEDDG